MIIAISNYSDQAARTGLRIFATNKLIDHFLGRLHKNVGQHLLAQRFNSLEDAIEATIRYIRKSQYHAKRFKVNHSSYVTCSYCKKIGHPENKCRKKAFHIHNRKNFQNNNHNRRDPVQNFDSSGNRSNRCKTIDIKPIDIKRITDKIIIIVTIRIIY
jgi:hypothetical protein